MNPGSSFILSLLFIWATKLDALALDLGGLVPSLRLLESNLKEEGLKMTNCAEVLERAERAFVATTNKARLAAQQHRERVGEARSIFVQSIVREAKKPRALADGEVSRALANIDEAIAFMGRTHEHKVELGNAPGTKGLEAVWRPFPRGIILGITPYNFPLNLVLHKVLPAICSGAPIILKPDPRTPTPAHELARALQDSGLPSDFLQVVDCSVEDADIFCRDPRVEVISFTGSERVGWSLKESAHHETCCLGAGWYGDCNLCKAITRRQRC